MGFGRTLNLIGNQFREKKMLKIYENTVFFLLNNY
jgi:hypothetical protein